MTLVVPRPHKSDDPQWSTCTTILRLGTELHKNFTNVKLFCTGTKPQEYKSLEDHIMFHFLFLIDCGMLIGMSLQNLCFSITLYKLCRDKVIAFTHAHPRMSKNNFLVYWREATA